MRTNPPAEAAVYCGRLPAPADDSVDALVIAYGDAINVYEDCAKRHKALVDWVN